MQGRLRYIRRPTEMESREWKTNYKRQNQTREYQAQGKDFCLALSNGVLGKLIWLWHEGYMREKKNPEEVRPTENLF